MGLILLSLLLAWQLASMLSQAPIIVAYVLLPWGQPSQLLILSMAASVCLRR
jgi:hypothetical protein